MLYDLLLIFTDTVGFVNYVYDCDVVYCISLISCVVIRLSLVLSSSFCRAMLSCGMCSFVCVCVRHVRTFFHKTNKHNFRFFSPSGSHTILVFPHQTAWQYSDANPPPPNEVVECRWGRQKSLFWANIWLHCVLWSVPAASAIHLAAKSHGEFITLVAGKRPSLLMAGNNDEMCDIKPQVIYYLTIYYSSNLLLFTFLQRYHFVWHSKYYDEDNVTQW